MIGILGLALVFLSAGAATAALPVNGDCTPELKAVRDQVAARIEVLTATPGQYVVQGGVMAILLSDGRIPCMEGIGYMDKERKFPIYPEVHLVEPASVSKGPTRAAVRAQKKWPLSMLAFCLAPSVCPFPLTAPPLDPRVLQITIQHLIDLKGGFPKDDSGDNRDIVNQGLAASSYKKKVSQLTRMEWIQWVVRTIPLVSDPGVTFNYSNASAMMMAEIVTQATGKDFIASLMELLPDVGWQPYMIDGHSSLPNWGQPRLVQGFGCTAEVTNQCAETGWENMQGAVGILMTAEGVLRFYDKYDFEGKSRNSLTNDTTGTSNGIGPGTTAQTCPFKGGTVFFYVGVYGYVGAEFCPLITAKTNFGTLDLRKAPRVVEFKHPGLNYLFNTGSDLEKAILLDARGTFNTTGQSWRAYSAGYGGGTADLKRGFFPNVPTHFYSALASDWAALQPLTQKAANAPDFLQVETATFSGYPAINDVCPAGTKPVYRSFRSGSPGVTPNHSFTPSLTLYNERVAQGYAKEGVSYCTRE